MNLPKHVPVAACRDARCGDPIVWAITAGRGRGMPVDLAASADGNVLLTVAAGSDTPVATVVDPNAPPLGGWPGSLHHSHMETCRYRADWAARSKR